MTLQLDARQRAMLKEMGVQVWLPGTEFAVQAPSAAAVAVAHAGTAPAPSTAPTAARLPPVAGAAAAPPPATLAPAVAPAPVPSVSNEGIPPDWATLVQRISACQACGLHAGRRQCIVRAEPVPAQADWLVVVDPPEEAEETAQAPVAGDAEVLLDNMLKAVGVARGGTGATGAYVTAVAKCRAPHATMASAQDLQQCLAHLRAEIALVRPRLVLLMGRFAQQLLQLQQPSLQGLALDRLRGTVHRLDALPAVVTYPPQLLLRSSPNKAKAWADLCLALDTLEAAPALPTIPAAP